MPRQFMHLRSMAKKETNAKSFILRIDSETMSAIEIKMLSQQVKSVY